MWLHTSLFSISIVLAIGAHAYAGEKAAASAVQAEGEVEPAEVFRVSASVPGVIGRLGPDPADNTRSVDFNTRVKRGTLLASVDAAPYQAALERERAGLQHAE